MSHNKKDKHGDTFQPGGTAILVLNEWAHHVMRPGDNTTGLGCWSWIRIRGKDNHHWRIVVTYCPCKVNGHLMTYQQQIRGQSTEGQLTCPCKKILQDLQEQITEWQSNGNQVIVLADMNEDVQEDPVWAMATQTGLKDAVTTHHSDSTPNMRGAHPLTAFLFQMTLFRTYIQGT